MDACRWRNVNRVRGDYRRHSPSVTGHPLEAFLEVSARCNLRCRMCPIAHDSRYRSDSGRPAILTPEVFSELRPVFPTLLRAYLYGLGEPLINPHLCDFIAELADAGVEPFFTTNATLVDEKKADEIARVGAHCVSISIDGVSPSTYESVRRGARWEDLIRGLRSFADARERHGRPKLTVNFVALASNIHELPKMTEFLAEYNIDELNVEPLLAWDSSSELRSQYGENSLGVHDREHVQGILEETRTQAEKAGIRLTSFFLVSEGSMDYKVRVGRPAGQGDIDCSEPWTTIFVTTAGEVRTCCLNDTRFGLLAENNIGEIWTGGSWSDFRHQHRRRSSTPSGCSFCIANGRQRLSPMVKSVEPVSFRPYMKALPPSRERKGWMIDRPENGAMMTDPILITGRAPSYLRYVPRRVGWWLLPEIVIGSQPVASLSDAVFNGDSFALTFRIPYLSEGDHVVSMAMPGEGGPGWCRRTIRFWRPYDDPNTITTGATLAVGQLLHSRARKVETFIDGNRWSPTRWYCGRVGNQWRGISVIDVADLETGLHRLKVKVVNHSPSHYLIRRVVE